MVHLSFKDFEINKTFDLGSITLSDKDIIEYAKNHDPLDFHIHKDVAKKSYFKGLVASAPHAYAVFYKYKWVPTFKSTVIGALEINIRFFKAIYANTKVYATVKITGIKENKEKKHAIVNWSFHLSNSKGEILQTIKKVVLHKTE